MNDTNYLYLIKTIENNSICFTTNVKNMNGVMMSDGLVCDILIKYIVPPDKRCLLSDVQQLPVSNPSIVRRIGKIFPDKVYLDHLSNEFETVSQLCAYHKISETKYRSHIAKGLTQKTVLTFDRRKKQVSDHLGNLFDSKHDMCQHYGISTSCFNTRIHAGLSVKEALLGLEKVPEMTVKDHLGNQYKTIKEMCTAYSVRPDVYCHRKKSGYTLEEALTGKQKSSLAVDHTGKTYSSLKKMCSTYGIEKATYSNRLKNGWSVEEALTGIRKECTVTDHLGNSHSSVKEMCKYHGVRYGTFLQCQAKGMLLEQALTSDTHKKLVKDHMGNTYPSVQKMCDVYHVKLSTYYFRKKRGYTTEDALTLKAVRTQRSTRTITHTPCQDHLGYHYNSYAEMARAYGLTSTIFRSRKHNGWNVEEILTTPINSRRICNNFDFNGIKYASKKDFCTKNKLNYPMFLRRLNAGKTIEEAVAADTHKEVVSMHYQTDEQTSSRNFPIGQVDNMSFQSSDWQKGLGSWCDLLE